ncbi:hypothetical protein BaRGS_00027332 [Batillaria attramentaria]|uniref:Uncharacterized protein n=1 Tax=Batillaria attramentaria TaxID=370345 RepID=A0ABD0K2Y5_9CAEN
MDKPNAQGSNELTEVGLGSSSDASDSKTDKSDITRPESSASRAGDSDTGTDRSDSNSKKDNSDSAGETSQGRQVPQRTQQNAGKTQTAENMQPGRDAMPLPVAKDKFVPSKDKPQQSVVPVRKGVELSFLKDLKMKHKFSLAFDHQNQVADTGAYSI